jgi:hypothetical protein
LLQLFGILASTLIANVALANESEDPVRLPPSQQVPVTVTRRAIQSGWPPPEVKLQRFKKQALQSVSIAGGSLFEFDDESLHQQFLEFGIGSGIPLGSFDRILGIRPRCRIDFLDAADEIDIPSELYEFECQFFYRQPIRPRLSMLAIVSPSIRSDLTTDDRAFRVFALGLLNWDWIPERLTISGGVVSLGRADLPVLPALGLIWTPNPWHKLDLRFPVAKLSRRLAKDGGRSEIWAYASGGLGGNTWSVTRRDGRSDELSLRDYRLMLGIERLVSGGGGCFAELGMAFGRHLEYERTLEELHFGDAAVIRAGWRY